MSEEDKPLSDASETVGDGLQINGEFYTADDLTYREQKKVRATVLELAGSEEEASIADVSAAFAFVILNRDREISLDEILDMKPRDLAAGPTKPRARKPPAKKS